MSSINSVEPGIHGSMRGRETVPCLPSGIIDDQLFLPWLNKYENNIELNIEKIQYYEL